ncbi:MAG: hypothetical protein CMF39_05490 [Legionellaceae bacterium]|nr:hypothetical protein [Legionellaceae bacterium]
MFMGHFATALVPYEKLAAKDAVEPSKKAAPFWIFLVGAQLLDFAMLLFVSLGVESFLPHDYHPIDTKFYNMQTDMWLTHDLIPVSFWAVGFAVVAFLLTRRLSVALWSFALVVFHEVLDLLVGFKHYVNGETSTEVGLALYTQAPFIGLCIEVALCALIVWWFTSSRAARGKPVSNRLKWILYGTLVGGTLSTLPMAI